MEIAEKPTYEELEKEVKELRNITDYLLNSMENQMNTTKTLANDYQLDILQVEQNDQEGTQDFANHSEHLKSASFFYMQIFKTLDSGNSWNGMFYIKKNKNLHIWVDILITPCLREEGPLNYAVLINDVTNRESNEKTKDYNTLLELIETYTRKATLVIDNQGQIIFFNKFENNNLVLSDQQAINEQLKSITAPASFLPDYQKAINVVETTDLVLQNALNKQISEMNVKYKKVTKAYNKLKLLSKIGKKIMSAISLQEIIDIVYDKLNKIMPAPVFGIGKIRQGNPDILDLFEFDFKIKHLVIRSVNIMNDKRLSSLCIQKNKKIIINSFDKEINHYLDDDFQYKAKNNFQSQIYLPLHYGKTNTGLIYVKNNKENTYNKFHLNILRNLAVYISIALRNANMLQLLKIQNENVNASIRYGLTLQNSILPNPSLLNKYFKPFIIYSPKDIVSGDFYWLSDKLPGNRTILVIADCTGHGVPGAFMSLIGNNILNEIVNETKIFQPSKILEFVDSRLKKIFFDPGKKHHDGMDIGICLFEKDHDKFNVTFSGAKNDLFHFSSSKNEVIEIKGDRRTIGYYESKRKDIDFTDKEFIVEKGDSLYMSTDGIIDQPNASRKKLGTKKFMEILKEICSLPVEIQKQAIESSFDQHRENEELRDDLTIIGLKF